MIRYVVAGAVVVLMAVGVFFLPLELTYTIEAPGKVWPAQSWTLVRDGTEAIGGMLHDHADGTVQSYVLNHFDRGDFVQLTLHPRIKPDARIAAGDTIATIFSNQTERELAQLSGELAATLAMLDVQAAGEKAAVVNEARMLRAQAEEEAAQHEKILERLRTLRARALISAQELEVAESQHRVLRANIAAAQARIDALQTGARPEEMDLTRTTIEALRQEMAALNDRQGFNTITAPIDGRVVRSFGSDTLLTIHHTGSYVVIMPISWAEQRYLRRGQDVEVQVQGIDAPLVGRLHHLGDTVHQFNGESVLLVTAVIEGGPHLLPGSMARCRVTGGTLSLKAYVQHLMNAPLS